MAFFNVFHENMYLTLVSVSYVIVKTVVSIPRILKKFCLKEMWSLPLPLPLGAQLSLWSTTFRSVKHTDWDFGHLLHFWLLYAQFFLDLNIEARSRQLIILEEQQKVQPNLTLMRPCHVTVKIKKISTPLPMPHIPSVFLCILLFYGSQV